MGLHGLLRGEHSRRRDQVCKISTLQKNVTGSQTCTKWRNCLVCALPMVGSSCRPLNLGSVCTQEVITISNSCLETEHVGVGYSEDCDAVPDVSLKPRNRMLALSYVNVKQLVMLLLAVCLLAIGSSPLHTAGAPPEEFCSVCIDTNSDFCCRFFNICCLGKYRLTSTCTWRRSVWYSFTDVSGLKPI
jgi:hypothetical protein